MGDIYLKNLAIVYVTEADRGIYTFVLVAAVILCIVFALFKRFDVMVKLFNKYYDTKDKIEGPVDFGPDIFHFFTMVIKAIARLFGR